MKGPPERESRPAGSGAAHSAGDATNTTSLRQALCRRRAASRRLPVLDNGRADPWHYDPPTTPEGYEEAATHLLGAGLMPAPNRLGLALMWRRGGHSRQAAQLITESWAPAK